MIEDLWYKNAVIYSLDVETFMDGNGDGIGDFRGLRRRLEYLASLGVTCLWLLPFYPTPNRDNGYDVSDYYGVDPRLGDLGDFVSFTHQARMHGMRVIVDLVANHTSDQHPWFQAARKDPSSRYRDYYVWSQEKPENADEGMIFPGTQKSTWTYDESAKAYYFHRFFAFQPDLNVANPAVREEILKVIGFWLELGVSGFRVDAVPFLVERQGAASHLRPAYEFLAEMRDFLSWRQGDAILLAEANVTMEEAKLYFGEGQRMQLAFNFIANQALFLTLAERNARPLTQALRSTTHLPTQAQWANFLRNHDELDLARLSEAERARVFEALGPDEDMQLFGRGLRRRLAPMLGGDLRLLKLAYSVLLTLPGAPVFWYGEEIGMGELLSLPGRMSVRTPMQWSSGPSAGFSQASSLVRPVVAEGQFAFAHVNVEDQRQDRDSLLSSLERMIRARRECPEIAWGSWDVLEVEDEHVLALRFTWRGSTLLALHNFGALSATVMLELEEPVTQPLRELTEGTVQLTLDEGGRTRVELAEYAFCWLELGRGRGMLRDIVDGEL